MDSYIVAVDLGCDKLVAALGIKGANGLLKVRQTIIAPLDGISMGELRNISQVTEGLRDVMGRLEAANGIHIDRVYVGLSGRDLQCSPNSCFVYVGNDGEIKESDLASIAENMNNLQAPKDKTILCRYPVCYTVDNDEHIKRPVGMFARQLGATYNFILADVQGQDRIRKAFERIGINDVRFIASPMASSYAAATPDEKDMGVAVIDMGAETTCVGFWKDGVLKYLGVIPLGCDAIDRDICSTSIPRRLVRDLKIKHGYATLAQVPSDQLNQSVVIKGHTARDDRSISYRDLTTIIESRLTEIIKYVITELKDSGYWGEENIQFVLTGGGSKMRGIESIFREHTGYEVRIATIETPIEDPSDEILEPTAAVCAGILSYVFDSTPLAEFKELAAAAKEAETVQVDDFPAQKPATEPQPQDEESGRRRFIRWRRDAQTDEDPEEPSRYEEPEEPKTSFLKKLSNFKNRITDMMEQQRDIDEDGEEI